MNKRSTRKTRCIMRGEPRLSFPTGTKTKSVIWDDLLWMLAFSAFCTKALDHVTTPAKVNNTLNLLHENFEMLTFPFIADYAVMRL